MDQQNVIDRMTTEKLYIMYLIDKTCVSTPLSLNDVCELIELAGELSLVGNNAIDMLKQS